MSFIALPYRPSGLICWLVTPLLLSVACQLENEVDYGPPGGLRNQASQEACTTPTKPAQCPHWANDVFPLFESNCAAATGCHDSQDSGVPPLIVNGDPSASYGALASYAPNGRPYIKDDGKSDEAYILCNLQYRDADDKTVGPDPSLDSVLMPKGAALSLEDWTTIAHWVACGMKQQGGTGGGGGMGQAGAGGASANGSGGAGGT